MLEEGRDGGDGGGGGGDGEEVVEQGIKLGTGRMWVSGIERENGWQGGFWDRVLRWFKNLFGWRIGVGGLEFHAENETPAKKKKLERIPAF